MRLKPLVLVDGQKQQLQGGADVDAPFQERIERLESLFALLVNTLQEEGVDVPDEILNELEDEDGE